MKLLFLNKDPINGQNRYQQVFEFIVVLKALGIPHHCLPYNREYDGYIFYYHCHLNRALTLTEISDLTTNTYVLCYYDRTLATIGKYDQNIGACIADINTTTLHNIILSHWPSLEDFKSHVLREKFKEIIAKKTVKELAEFVRCNTLLKLLPSYSAIVKETIFDILLLKGNVDQLNIFMCALISEGITPAQYKNLIMSRNRSGFTSLLNVARNSSHDPIQFVLTFFQTWIRYARQENGALLFSLDEIFDLLSFCLELGGRPVEMLYASTVNYFLRTEKEKCATVLQERRITSRMNSSAQAPIYSTSSNVMFQNVHNNSTLPNVPCQHHDFAQRK